MRKHSLLSALLALLLLCGCNGTSISGENQNGTTDAGGQYSSLTVCADENYRYALQQVFSHVNMTENDISILWTGDMSTADVVITDRVPESDFGKYMVLDMDALDFAEMEQLTLRTQQGVIGLPLFLRLDGFWYDQLLYANHDVAVPHSLDSWLDCPLNTQYPAVCHSDSIASVFWGMVAPLYLSFGGTEEDLALGVLKPESLLPALEQVVHMVESRALVLSDRARESFTSVQAEFWIAGVDQVAKYYTYKSNLSAWDISLAAPFDTGEKPQCVVRADVILIRNTVDKAVAERFLNLFYENKVLTDISDDTKMPMACQISYAPSVVPELAYTCYTALSSPRAELRYVVCSWSDEKTKSMETVLLDILGGELTAHEAVEQICKD